MKHKNTYSIILSSLPIGRSHFSFEIDDALFDDFQESEVQHVMAKAVVIVSKSVIITQLEILIEGQVTLPCDRCLDDLTIPIKFHGAPVIKFAKIGNNENYIDDENILWVSEANNELNLTQYFYDCIILGLPLQRTHSEQECNKEMIVELGKFKI